MIMVSRSVSSSLSCTSITRMWTGIVITKARAQREVGKNHDWFGGCIPHMWVRK